MADCWSALQLIAEERIKAAQENGDFENLPGQGQPLKMEDMTNVPEELRLGYKILKNAGYIPEELAIAKEIITLSDLLQDSEDERECMVAATRLKYLLERLPLGCHRHAALQAHVEYYQKALALLVRYNSRQSDPEE